MNTGIQSIQLESEARAFAEAVAKPPFLFELRHEKGRTAFDEIQSGAVSKLPVDIEDLKIEDGPTSKSPSASCDHRTLQPYYPSSYISMARGGYLGISIRMTG